MESFYPKQPFALLAASTFSRVELHLSDANEEMRIFQVAVLWVTVVSLLVPVRSLAQRRGNPLSSEVAPSYRSGNPDPYDLEATAMLANTSGLVPVQVRMAYTGGPFAHKWIQIGHGDNAITFGYGAANFPLVDAGQVVVADRHGVELVSRWHLFRGHITPAEGPDRGHPVGKPVFLTVAHAQKLIWQQRRHRFLMPYIPLFHDCHTYTCEIMASAQGKSVLPCFLFLKNHF